MIAGWWWKIGVEMLYIVIGTQRKTSERCETLYKNDRTFDVPR
jgi:hypothetical protein